MSQSAPQRQRRIGNNVYVASDSRGAIKIGFTCELQKRLRSLSREVGARVTLIFAARCGVDGLGDPRARVVERRAHQILAERRIKGEWFRVTETEAISAVIAGASFAQTTLTPIEVVLH